MSEVLVRDLGREEHAAAGRLLAEAMLGNPVHVAAFADDEEGRLGLLERLFGFMLGAAHRPPLAAERDGALAGVAGLAAPGGCRPGRLERLRLTPRLVHAVGAHRLPRVASWFGAWEAGDLGERHWHLGPLGVREADRGTGVGSALVAAALERAAADRLPVAGVTDREDVAAWLGRRGLATVGRGEALGVPCWFVRG